jgi:hypothetical protein
MATDVAIVNNRMKELSVVIGSRQQSDSARPRRRGTWLSI